MNVKEAAVQALDTQLKFINFYKSEQGMKSVYYFLTSMTDKKNIMGPPDMDPDEFAAKNGVTVAGEMAKNLASAETFYMTEEMMELNHHAGEKLPSILFTEEDPPSDAGFLLLPHALTTIDINGARLSAHAFAWWRSTVTIYSEDEDGERNSPIVAPSLMIAAFSNKNDREYDDYFQERYANDKAFWLKLPTWSLVHWCPIYFQGAYADMAGGQVRINIAGEQEVRMEIQRLNSTATGSEDWYAFLRSFFLLVRQKIAVVHDQHPGRAGARRWQSAGLPPEYGQIQVVTLRKERPTSPDEVGDGTPMNWSHRWIVSGHWRNQWYPSLGRHEPIWINNFIKGPEDKPLIVKDKVFVWKR